ncbi:MAG: DNA/RNA nuclease SfsA [Candidatus Thermoplasmatota archaeon]
MTSLLEIPSDARGVFKNRKNRFLGEVEVDKTLSVEEVHIRDPGRLSEILYPGNEVLLEKAESGDRKTDWTLLAGKVKKNWVFVNSGYHRSIAEKLIEDAEISPFGEPVSYKAEKRLGKSRIDFLLEKDEEKIWVEVKGCTLAENGEALFPDAPTERGKRHIEELVEAINEENTSASLLFLVFRSDASCFKPHKEQDHDFARVFEKGVEAGLDVHPIRLNYDGSVIEYRGEIPLCE